MRLAIQVNLTDPVCRLGSRRARLGPPVTRHLPHAVCVIHTEHGRLCEGWQGAWEGGKGARAPCKRQRGRQKSHEVDRHPMRLWSEASQTTRDVSSILLKDAMRRRQAFKTWCLAVAGMVNP